VSDVIKNIASESVPAKPSRVQRWLETCARELAAQSALILVRQGKRATIDAIYPPPRDGNVDVALTSAARRAFKEKQVVVRTSASKTPTAGRETVSVAFRMRISGRPAAIAFVLEVPADKSDQELISEIASQVLRRAEDSSSKNTESPASAPIREAEVSVAPAETVATNGSDNQTVDDKTQLLAEQSAVIHTLSTLLDQREFAQSLHAFANALAQSWSCLRVTIALVRSRRVAIEAVSGVVDFDPRSALMVDITQALEETRTAAATIALPVEDKDLAPPQCHAALASQLKDPALLSLPLIDDGRVVGAMLLERDRRFSGQEQQQLERLAIMLAPVVVLKRIEAMGPLQWSGRLVKKQLRTLFGATKLGWKLSAIATFAFLLWCSMYTQTFKIGADAAIEASVQRAVVASFPSFIDQVEKRAGDMVFKGDILARLDIEDLQLDRIKWTGERDKLAKEYRANLAQRDRSKVRILEAQRAQAQSQIDLLDAQISRATLRAPIDGVVISGDLSQALRSPVERGQLLFEVASLDDYRLILMVDEADIGWVKIEHGGHLRLRSLPDQSFPFTVTSISPVSESGDGANRFRVEASLGELPITFRPGMEGVAKIEIEPRVIGWIWTRSFMNWARLKSWKYGW
jgi:hypothetical protein